jgi:membrane protein DedA with SNARE-associated domain
LSLSDRQGGDVTPTRTGAGRLAVAGLAVVIAAANARAGDRSAVMRALDPDPAYVAEAVRMMTGLRAESVRHAAAIRDAYAPAVARFALTNRAGLQQAMANGSILALPPDPAAHNLRPRLTGRHPIGEADPEYQHLYVGARPEAVGLLLAIASRVPSGPLEITSLARHEEYQRRLARTNANAQTAVPTHVMGLAFDISILHTSLAHATEIRDVLREMARAGDLHFIAERQQLVFHVVPSPARRSHYAALARRAGEAGPVRPQPAPAAADDAAAEAIAEAAPSTSGSRSLFVRYAGLFAWLVGAGLGTPPGEDLFLAAAGALVSNGALAWWPMLVLAIVGVVTSDVIMFLGGRTAAAPIARRSGLASRAATKRLDRVLRRWGSAAVAAARFMPGVRALVFVSAGARGMRLASFALVDICAAIVWVPLMMTLGAWGLGALGAAGPLFLEAWV